MLGFASLWLQGIKNLLTKIECQDEPNPQDDQQKQSSSHLTFFLFFPFPFFRHLTTLTVGLTVWRSPGSRGFDPSVLQLGGRLAWFSFFFKN